MAQNLMENQFETQWLQLRSSLRDKFRNLTDEDVKQINGRYDMLVAKLQLRYGYSREEAEEHIQEWVSDKSSRIASSREKPFVRANTTDDNYARRSDSSSLFKWVLALGIPLLLLATYFGMNSPRNIDNTTTAPRYSSTAATPADTLLSDSIRTAFRSNAVLAPFANNIDVETTNGVTTLSGYAPTTQDRDLIVNTARNVSGVRQVINNIEIR